MNHILLENNNSTCTLTINRPEALNALNAQLLTELSEALDVVKADKSIRALVITGAGRSFVAGADIAEMAGMNSVQGLEFGKFGAQVFRKLELLPIPVIAAVNGFALGGGCELMLACDIRVASEKAKFGQPEVSLGITPGFSGTVRLPRVVGAGMAKELLFTGKTIDAAEALRIGLVNHVVAPDELMNVVGEMAAKIASCAPIAVKYSKECVDATQSLGMDEAISFENELFGKCFDTQDQKEGMKAFMEKRLAKFENR